MVATEKSALPRSRCSRHTACMMSRFLALRGVAFALSCSSSSSGCIAASSGFGQCARGARRSNDIPGWGAGNLLGEYVPGFVVEAQIAQSTLSLDVFHGPLERSGARLNELHHGIANFQLLFGVQTEEDRRHLVELQHAVEQLAPSQ